MSIPKPIAIPKPPKEKRFLFLLLAIIGYMVIATLLGDFVEIRIPMDILLSTVLISGIFAVSKKKLPTILALIFALPMLTSVWTLYFVDIPSLRLAGDIFGILFFSLLGYEILHYIFKQEEITLDLVNGAVVVYLLLGIMWTFMYTIVDFLRPGSFTLADPNLEQQSQLFYYSFVTLSTLGYGDITPATSTARMLSYLEAIIGQIYLTVLVARLVGMQISQSMENKSKSN